MAEARALNRVWASRVRLPPRVSLVDFSITMVHRDVGIGTSAPWIDGAGPWTILEVELVGGGKLLFGAAGGAEPPFERAMLAPANVEEGERALASVGRCLGCTLPPPVAPPAPVPTIVKSMVYGDDLVRQPDGAMHGGGGGWTAAKWLLEPGAELLVHWNLAERRGEMLERDRDGRGELWRALTAALRDGPPPERAPDNDPTLSDAGPRFVDMRVVAEAGARCHGWEGSRILVSRSDGGGVSRLVALDPEGAEADRPLGDIEGEIMRTLGVDPDLDRVLAWCAEAGGARFHLLDRRSSARRELVGPWDRATARFAIAPTSPGGRFVAIVDWWPDPECRHVRRRVHLLDLELEAIVGLHLAGRSLELVGWRGEREAVRALLLAGEDDDPPDQRPAYEADPLTGTLDPLAADVVVPRSELSRSGRWSYRIRPREALLIRDCGSGAERALEFHPSDRRHVRLGNFEWMGDDHLLFEAERPAIIDARSLRLSYPLPADAPETRLLPSPDLRWVLAPCDDGVHVGRVIMPEGGC